ncbi:hypothetical protein CgunFtcFv8_017156 [Champsocephalus gunnari]|uniref:Uncharacterized protein n=1 Tax=Champsocephalus gunnari TaxID=52237 RepID=A0AAN8DKA9_CHAGU|nr:hypothetical protein CgunFtcFv8_017156 [Champsocephalus gunnari]
MPPPGSGVTHSPLISSGRVPTRGNPYLENSDDAALFPPITRRRCDRYANSMSFLGVATPLIRLQVPGNLAAPEPGRRSSPPGQREP